MTTQGQNMTVNYYIYYQTVYTVTTFTFSKFTWYYNPKANRQIYLSTNVCHFPF